MSRVTQEEDGHETRGSLPSPSAVRYRLYILRTLDRVERVFITNVKGTFLGMSESEEASKRR